MNNVINWLKGYFKFMDVSIHVRLTLIILGIVGLHQSILIAPPAIFGAIFVGLILTALTFIWKNR
jgi:hypothetical protein